MARGSGTCTQRAPDCACAGFRPCSSLTCIVDNSLTPPLQTSVSSFIHLLYKVVTKAKRKSPGKLQSAIKKKKFVYGGDRHPLPNIMTFSATRRERSFVSHFWTGFVRDVPVCLSRVWSAGPRWRMGASGPLPGSVSPGDGPLLERDPQI